MTKYFIAILLISFSMLETVYAASPLCTRPLTLALHEHGFSIQPIWMKVLIKM
jgi:hypothetical protein